MASKTQLGTEIAALQDTCLTNCIFLKKTTTAQLDWQDHIALDLRVDSCGNELLPRLDETNCHFPAPLPKRFPWSPAKKRADFAVTNKQP